MYKKQLVFQKIVCLLSVISTAAVFIYSLGIMTDLYDCLYSTMMDPNHLDRTDVAGSIVYYDMQGFNRTFTRLSIVLILISLSLFVTNTNTRRKYYIGNYISTGLNVLADLAFAVWAHIEIEKYKAQFLQVDFEALKAHSELWKTAYTESTFWFDLHRPLFAVLLGCAALLVVNLVWKIIMMTREQHLIAKGKEAAV